MLTVREAMKTGGLSKCRLLAGEAGLDNAITCVDCMEVPNIEPWLRSGELLITTGYALRDDENAIPYLLETLTKGKAAALAIKTRFLGELKDTDIALAQRLGLPLFEMPSDMPTTEMVMPVVRMLTNRQVEIMEFSEKIHKRFTEIELSDGGFGKIAAVLSKLLQMPAAIVDGAGEILAASHIPDNFEDLEDYILQEVLGQGSAAERCPREARGYTVFSRSVTVREAVRGYILVFCPVAALNEMQMIILDHSVTAAALEFSKRDSIRDNVNQLNTALFLDLVLRNNITTEEHPLGVYHPHAKLHHIKKENIGLIEVMGLAVLPARLKDEMADLEQAILDGADIRADEKLAKHADWVEEFLPKYGFTAGSGLEGEITPERLHEIVQTEIGLVFKEVLTDAGVYKCTEEGRAAFMRFVDTVNA